jgi:hypothetical protein
MRALFGVRPWGGMQPICSTAFEVQPPIGHREFPAERDGSSHFFLKTEDNSHVEGRENGISASLLVP